MGEAKRKRAAAKTVRTTEVRNVITGETMRSRVTCSPMEFLREMEDFATRDAPGQRASTRTPCNGCRECCWYSKVQVRPEIESPADLRHLDMVADANGDGLVLRKKADGSCIHLGDDGCEVYHHRPRACRAYDCRTTGVVGLRQMYDNGHCSPTWHFPPRTEEEGAVFTTLSLAAMQEAIRHPERDGRDIAEETLRTLPDVMQQMTAFNNDPDTQRMLAAMQALTEDEKAQVAEMLNAAVRDSFAGAAK